MKISRKIDKVLNKINFPVFAVILVFIIGTLTLFIKPIVGMANNGDFFRIISSNNLYYLHNKDGNVEYFDYFQKDYGISNFYNDNEKLLVSTQSLIIRPAILLDKIITGNDEIFDLRFLAAILLIVHAIAAFLIVKVLIKDLKRPIFKLIVTLLYIFIFMDTGYIAYFNSFYGEGVNIPFFLLSVGIFMYMIKFNKFTWYNIIFFFITSVIFFGAKQQLAPVGILLGILIFRVICYEKEKSIKVICTLIILLLVLTSGYLYTAIKGDFDYINRYHSLNRGILLDERDSDKILKDMNINEQYSLLENTIYFTDVTQIDLKDKALIKSYYDKFEIGNIIKYYIFHPSDMYKMANIGFNNSYFIRPMVLGNYESIAKKSPGEKSYFFAAWSTIKEKLLPKSFLASVIYIFIFFYFSIKRYIKSFNQFDKETLQMEELFLYIFLVGLSQIVISLIGAGDADLSKHEFMYNMSFDIMFIYFIVNILKYNKSNIKEEKFIE